MHQSIIRTHTEWRYIKEIKYILLENDDVLMHPSDCKAFLSISSDGTLCHPDIAEEREHPGTTFDMEFVEGASGCVDIRVTARSEGVILSALDQVLFLNFVEALISSTENLVNLYQLS